MALDVSDSIPALLSHRARTEPTAPLLSIGDDDRIVTVAQMDQWAASAASLLKGLGLDAGDRIALWGHNSAAWAALFFGAARLGVAVVALHPQLEGEALAYALGKARPRWLFCDETARDAPLRDRLRALRRYREMAGDFGETLLPGGDGVVDPNAFLEPDPPPTAISGMPDAALCLQFTSGSTGQPKIAVLSCRALLANAQETGFAAGIAEGDRIASPLPFYHVAGLSSGLVLALQARALLCSSPRFRPSLLLEQIGRHACTVVQGVPTMFQGLLAHRRDVGVSTPSLRLGFMGGAPCPQALVANCIEELGLERVALVYGQTEFGATIALTSGSEPAHLKTSSVGRALSGTDIQIVDIESGSSVAEGEEGEILVRGPSMMDGYFDDEEATSRAITQDGWLRTGDVGRAVEGCLKITGRVKDLIIRGGENVAPHAVEEAFADVAGVINLVAVPSPSDFWGEEICLVVQSDREAIVSLDVLRAVAEQRLPRFMRPDHFVVRFDLPHLSSGKIDRVTVRKAIQSGAWSSLPSLSRHDAAYRGS